MDPPFEQGDTAYVHRNVVVDPEGEEIVDGATSGSDDDVSWERVLQEVTVIRVEEHQAVVAHSGNTHRYHVDKLREDASGPDEVKPKAWNP